MLSGLSKWAKRGIGCLRLRSGLTKSTVHPSKPGHLIRPNSVKEGPNGHKWSPIFWVDFPLSGL